MLLMKKLKQCNVKKSQKKVVMAKHQNALLTICGSELEIHINDFFEQKNLKDLINNYFRK